MEWSRQEALALTVAGEMLGIRLRERVREQLSGTYSISVNTSGSSLPDDEYQVSIIFGSDPNRTEELLAEVLAEVNWLREGASSNTWTRSRSCCVPLAGTAATKRLLAQATPGCGAAGRVVH